MVRDHHTHLTWFMLTLDFGLFFFLSLLALSCMEAKGNKECQSHSIGSGGGGGVGLEVATLFVHFTTSTLIMDLC